MKTFYFVWVGEIPKLPDPDESFQNKRIVALDPGCAPFQQWCSPTSGEYGELHFRARDGLKKQYLCIDKLHRRLNHRKKHHMVV